MHPPIEYLEFGLNFFFAFVFFGFVIVGLVQRRMYLTLRSAVIYRDRPALFLSLWFLYALAGGACVWQALVFMRR